MRYPGEIAAEDYDAHPGERWSRLKNMRKSPLHYQHGLSAANAQSRPMALGSAVHTLVWEPHLYDERFAVYAESKSKGAGSRTAWEAYQATETRAILTPEEQARAQCMAEALTTHRAAGDLLTPGAGRMEVPLTWTCPRTGIMGKARLDWLLRRGPLVDLKTTRSGEARRFSAQAWSIGYFHQLSWYQDAVSAATGQRAEEVPVFLVAVESEAPYDVAVFEPCSDTMVAARNEVAALVDLLLLCRGRNEWPGRYEAPQILSAPAYVLNSDEENWQTETMEAL